MERFFTVARVVTPIFVSIFLGVLARKKNLVTPSGVEGMQQFVMQFGLPCVIFNSCLTADIGLESLSSMAMAIVMVLFTTFWSFRARKNKYPYHNLPQLFDAQETGMLGIPLYMILFGAQQAYRMGVLDLAQAVTAFPVLALLSSKSGDDLTPMEIVKKVLKSPLMIMCAIGLFLNISGIGSWMDSVGIGGVVTECTGFLTQPVSAMMIFSVGYNFSLKKECLTDILGISLVHFAMCASFAVLIQLALFLVPNVDSLTRWALLLYCMLPSSYLAPGLGRTEKDYTVASGVCSILTVVTLAVFCVMTVIVA